MKNIFFLILISISVKSSSGQILFQKTYEDSSPFSLGDVQKTSLGGFIAAGSNNDDALVVKFDAFGNVEWNKRFGDPAHRKIRLASQKSPL